MIRKVGKKDKMNFLLENKDYQRLHLYLYLASIAIIVCIYFLGILLFSSYTNIFLSSVVSLTIGLYLIYNRDKLVRQISSKIQDKKRRKNKENNKKGLKTTLNKITPKNRNLKFNIKAKVSLKDKMSNIKKKFNKNKSNKTKEDYIEIK